MASTKERIPPQAIEAEQTVLGAILQHTEALHLGIEALRDDDFYLPKHRKIFSAIRKLYDSSMAVDLITVPDELAGQGTLDEVGGRRYLLDLVDSVVTVANLEHHVRIVREAATKNKLISECSDIIGRCYEPGTNADDLLDYAESKVFSIKEESLHGDFYSSEGDPSANFRADRRILQKRRPRDRYSDRLCRARFIDFGISEI